ncbi:Hsp70 family protein [Tessaracoccus sp. Y1736]
MAESYYLGIDVGTARVAAATARPTHDGSVVVSHVPLGHRNDNAPAVVFVTSHGGLLFGDTAERRGVAEPEHLVREFTRNVGDDVPLSVGGHSVDAPHLLAQTVASVVSTATESEGTEPAGVTVTYPSSWGPHRTGLIRSALSEVGLRDVALMSEAEAAARNFEATHPLEPGRSVVVYDLGGTTFHTAVTRKGRDGSLSLVGQPLGLDNLGGADFDDLVFRHVLRGAGAEGMDLSSSETRDALIQLRRECVDGKEALSFDTEVTIPVLLPQVSTKIRLTRSEFESMIDEHLERTVGALDDAVEGAGVDISDVDAIVLVGGSSRIPRVAQRLSELFDRPIVVDQDPKSSTAMGAARGSLFSHVALAHPSTALAIRPDGEVARIADDENDDTAIVAVHEAAAAEPVPRARWWSGLALAAVAVTGLVMIGGTLLSELTAGEEGSSPQAAAFQAPVTLGPSGSSAAPETSTSVAGQTPAPAAPQDQQQPQQQPVAQQDPIIQRETETVEKFITTETFTTVTAPPPAGAPTTQRPAPTMPTPTKTTATPTTQAPAPTTQAPAPTTQAPAPTTQAPAPTTQAPDPTTQAPDPTTQAPDPTTQAPDPVPTTEDPAPVPVTEDPTPASSPESPLSASPDPATAL